MENQDIYDANQRKFSKAGISKIRQCYMNAFFLRPISFIQEPMDMNLNDSHSFAN